MKNCFKIVTLGICTILAISSVSGNPNWPDDKPFILEKLLDAFRRLKVSKKIVVEFHRSSSES